VEQADRTGWWSRQMGLVVGRVGWLGARWWGGEGAVGMGKVAGMGQEKPAAGPGSHSSRGGGDQRGPGWSAGSQWDGAGWETGDNVSLVGGAWAGQWNRVRWVDWVGQWVKMGSK